MNEKLESAMLSLENSTDLMGFTFAPDEFWKMKYQMKSEEMRDEAEKHRNQLWQLTALSVVLISFAFILGLSL